MPHRTESGCVYLLHLNSPFGHAQHYMGFAKHALERRLSQHGTSKSF
jgi:hypothetical protein